MGQDGRHELGRATRPSFRLQRDKWREPRTRTMKGPNTEKKAAIWPTSRVSGEQASSPAEGSARAQGHLCDCPRPSLGWVSLSHRHPALGSRAGAHTPGATEAPGSEAEELRAPRVKQGAWLPLEDIDLVPLHGVQVVVQRQQHQK